VRRRGKARSETWGYMTNTIQHRSGTSGRLLRGASAGAALAVALGSAFAAMPSARAQTRYPAPVSRPAPTVQSGFTVGTRFPLRGGRGFFRGSRFSSFPYWAYWYPYWDYWYPPYFLNEENDSEQRKAEAPTPQVVVIDPSQASANKPPSPPESLLLELQGDQWVRVTSPSQSPVGAQAAQPESPPASAPRSVTPRIRAAEPLRELPPAVLVYRDGHQEVVEDYTIIGPTLYTSADYWSSGSWTREVQIAQLDIPATLKINRERGLKFSLPSGPGEIVVRP